MVACTKMVSLKIPLTRCARFYPSNKQRSKTSLKCLPKAKRVILHQNEKITKYLKARSS